MNPVARRLLIAGGLTLFVGPGIGVLANTVSLARVFSTLEESGVARPEQLAQFVGDTLIFTFIGFSVGIIGALTLIAGGIVWLVNRPPSNQGTPAPLPR